ncbi:MAG: UDP-N-acetylmuramate dehydrogenase [Desulfobacteraceae bacterium]|nr:UDP-N-acetylmuramate dehydrogenase [Desulfobacteraceae bacterium]MBC2756037.1 UDP-N-acetylmuramate dehydrogenase [Desulfobacteraceae bacterium]
MAIQSELKKQLKNRFFDRVRFDEPMAPHTSFRVGGPADAYVTATDENEMTYLIKWVKENNLPFFIIGGGTNLLVKDQGIRGVVISMADGLVKISQHGATVLSAMAGASLSALCRFAINHGLSGLNFALGIPGTVGGAIRMNAGAWKGDMSDVLDSIRIILPDGSIESVDKTGLTFSYRSLSFAAENRRDLSSCVIIEGRFLLSHQRPEFLKAKADSLLNARKKSQPTGFASAGCFFKNPDNRESAGKLIDLAGGKNLRVGDAEVSTKHANFIVNRGRATAEDILRLMNIVQEAVFKKFNIMLEPEVKIVGD